MVTKRILNPDRIRRIGKGFSFIPHRFLTGGFLSSLTQAELLLYLFLVVASVESGHRDGVTSHNRFGKAAPKGAVAGDSRPVPADPGRVGTENSAVFP